MGDRLGSGTSQSLAAEVGRFRGGVGSGWLAELPSLLDACRRRWGLTLAEPFGYPSLSFVAPAVRNDGSAAVLKVGFLLEELACESEALRRYDGRGAVRLLDDWPERGALLLERLVPGSDLAGVEDDVRATSIAARAMGALWRPVAADHRFPTIAEWMGGLTDLRRHFGGGTGPLPVALVERAERIARELLANQSAPVVLHGDLQHHNILRAERAEWLAIDPKGVVGEPAYEVGAFLRNRLGDGPEAGRRLARRVDQFADELAIDRARVHGWGLSQAVLSAWWSIEDHGDWREAIACAALLAGMPREGV